MSTDSNQYARGPTHPNANTHPSVETKPTTQYSDTRHDSGGGYERARSWEVRPHTSRQGPEDVYAPIHRLCAVAWLLPDDCRTDYLRLLDGKDVHHGHPASWPGGVEWLNIHDSPNLPEAGLELLDHGRHSEITNAERRAWAEQAREDAEAPPDPDRCSHCGDDADVLGESEDFDGLACLDCAKRLSDGAPIEVVS